MSDRSRKKIFAAAAAAFALYGALAARPVPQETVLAPRWLGSLESGLPTILGERRHPPAGDSLGPLPFEIGDRFGYVGMDGAFLLNRAKTGRVSISPGRWAEFGAQPESVEIRGPSGELVAAISDPGGYPFFLDGRYFVMGSGQSSVTEFDASGAALWTFDFPSQVIVADAAAGLFLAGLLDGAAVLVDGQGRQAFSFEPGGSRFSIVLGAAISGDGSRLAVVSGIDSQRFLALERLGAGPGGAIDFRVVYHEFLGEGFRRPVHVSFVDGGRRAVFEREGGIGIYDAGSRSTRSLRIDGELRAIDGYGGQGLLFAVFDRGGGAKDFVGMRISGRRPGVAMLAPFRSGSAFVGRMGSRLVVGGDRALAAFDLERR